MARPAKPAPERRGSTITFKLTTTEAAWLKRLAAARADEIREQTGQLLDVTVAAYLRWLMHRDAVARGLALDEEPKPKPRRKASRPTPPAR